MFRFSDIVKVKEKNGSVTDKIISDRREMSEIINDTEAEYASTEDSLSMHITTSPKQILFLRFHT